jgi:hypothetical protein
LPSHRAGAAFVRQAAAKRRAVAMARRRLDDARGAMVKVIGAAETPLRAGADAERRPLREVTRSASPFCGPRR